MGSLSPMLIAGTAVSCLGLLLHIVGLSTDNWVEKGEFNAGAWKYCLGSTCVDWDDKNAGTYWEAIQAVQAMIILGMLCGLVGCVLAVVMLIFSFLSKTVNSMMPIGCVGGCIAAFVFIIIGVIVFGAEVYKDRIKESSDLAYSFALCIVGGLLLPVGGGLAYMGGKALV